MNTELLAFRGSKELSESIKKLSDKERRTKSNMLRVLVIEALEARKIIAEKAA